MTTARPSRVLLLTWLAAAAAAGCGGPKRLVTPAPAPQSLIVLLPDGNGTTGRASVSTAAGAVNLSAPRSATQVLKDRPPGDVTILSEVDVTRLFGDALSALPLAPYTVTVYFKFESDELTEPSKELLPEILKSVTRFPAPEVVVVGHTDTRGTMLANFTLGLKRAETVRRLLLYAGLDSSLVDATSLGETYLLVRTADETAEPRNRRVEITIK
jgi:outer membrane protein OmpA-like peptidoglycan-associated protein